MRLIDADLIKAYIIAACDGQISKRAYILWDFINKLPTAYDVDKVVEQLERRSVQARPVGWTKSYEIVTLKDAIEIVKGGVIDG